MDGRSNGGGHRARSLPFITEPTAHTTSSPQIRDVLFFSLPSTLFSHAPRQFDRTPTPTPAPAPTITTTPDLATWICIWNPDLTLCVLHAFCTAAAHPYSCPGGGIVTATSFHHHPVDDLLPAHPRVCKTRRQAARDKDTEKSKSTQKDSKPLHRVNSKKNPASLAVVSVRLSSIIQINPPVNPPAASQPGHLNPPTTPATSRPSFARLVSLNSSRGVTS